MTFNNETATSIFDTLDKSIPRGVTTGASSLPAPDHVRQDDSIRALVAAVEAKDPYTRTHSHTVADYCDVFAERMGVATSARRTLHVAALLHDVGKIAVPDAILSKPSRLTTGEFEVMKRHPQTAIEILGHIRSLQDVKPIILHHHERFDGTGYPCGLRGNDIPLGSRILAVADAIDTMLSPRVYKEPFPLVRVRRELKINAGRQFDPSITNMALRWLDESPRH